MSERKSKQACKWAYRYRADFKGGLNQSAKLESGKYLLISDVILIVKIPSWRLPSYLISLSTSCQRSPLESVARQS